MTREERIAVIIALYVIACVIFCHSLTGRYQWIPGQKDIHGIDYIPKIFDTWTGKYQFPN